MWLELCVGALLAVAPGLKALCTDEYQDARCHCQGQNVSCLERGLQHDTLLTQVPRVTRVLVFTGNKLLMLSVGISSGGEPLHELVKLDLSNNAIHTIVKDAFGHLPVLEELILSDNSWHVFSAHASLLRPLPQLRILALRSALLNPADSADSRHSISNLSAVVVGAQLQNLEHIDLERNHITKMDNPLLRLFCSLPLLRSINLRHNLITSPRLSANCTSRLRSLDLSNNAITGLEPIFMQRLDWIKTSQSNTTVSLDLRANPLRCDCGILGLHRWLSSTDITLVGRDSLRCIEGRKDLQDSVLDSLNVKDVDCSSEVDTSIVIMAVMFGLVGVCAVVVCYLNRRKFRDCYELKIKRLLKTSAEEDHGNVHYSAMDSALNDRVIIK